MTLWEEEPAMRRLFSCHINKAKTKFVATCQHAFLKACQRQPRRDPGARLQLHIGILGEGASTCSCTTPDPALLFPARPEYCSRINVPLEMHSRALNLLIDGVMSQARGPKLPHGRIGEVLKKQL